MAEHSHDNHGSRRGGRGGWVFLGFVLIAGFFLLTEHRAHVFQYLPFVLILACPLLHLFHGHGGHGGHGGHRGGQRSDRTRGAEPDNAGDDDAGASKPAKDADAPDKPAAAKRHGCH